MKDVIYIDIEDDVTAIIGKVKDAGSKIVALVPPKRPGVLQSVVNLKLLQKGAGSVDKHVVLITSDHSLVALAAGLKIPVAKNLQSRPEIPNMASPIEDQEEVINGAELPVGELAGMRKPEASPQADKISDAADANPASVQPPATPSTPTTPPAPAKKMSLTDAIKKKAGKFNIPNFGSFRKKLFLFGGIGLLVIAVLIWAFVFAPHANVTISARTTAVNIDRTLALDPNLDKSKPSELLLKPNVQQVKKEVVVEFDATGKKQVGDKASGEVTFNNSSSSDSVVIGAGTVVTAANGKKFTLNNRVVVPGAEVEGGDIVAGSATDTVTAAQLGESYNIGAQSYTVQGRGNIEASGEKMSGGTSRDVKVVSDEDVQTAQAELEKPNEEEIKNELKQKFGDEFIVIDESFAVEQADPSVSPSVGEEAQRAKLTQETTYTLIGLTRDDVKPILEKVVNAALKGKSNLQQYSLGENAIAFQTFQRPDGGKFSTRLVTTGYIGPKIDTQALANKLVGKRYGEIQAITQEIPGVEQVDINFSPFWVTTAPAADKIDISFSVDNDNQ